MKKQRANVIRELVKGAGVIYVGLLIEIIIAFVAQVLAARFLSTSGFGGITMGTALVNVGMIVGTLGFGEGLTRFLPRCSDEEKTAIVQTAFLVAFPFALIIGFVLVFGSDYFATVIFGEPDVAVSIRIFGSVIPLAAVLTISNGGIRGQKYSRYRVYTENVVQPVSRFSLVSIAAAYGVGQAGFARAYAVPYVLGAVMSLYYFKKTIPEFTPSFLIGKHRDIVVEFVKYSLPFTISKAAYFIVRSVDIFLVMFFLGSSAVGVYGVAYAVAQLMLMFSTAFNYLGVPITSQLESEDSIDEVVRINESILRWLVVVSIPVLVPLVIFPSTFIETIYNNRYVPGATSLAILATSFAIHNPFSAHGNIIRSLGHSGILAGFSFIQAFLNVILNLYLIPRYGIEGAAIATACSYLLGDFLSTFAVWRLTGMFVISRRIAGLFLLAVPLLGITVSLTTVLPLTVAWMILITVLFALLYFCGVLVAFGLSEEDTMILRSIEEKYGVDLPFASKFIHDGNR